MYYKGLGEDSCRGGVGAGDGGDEWGRLGRGAGEGGGGCGGWVGDGGGGGGGGGEGEVEGCWVTGDRVEGGCGMTGKGVWAVKERGRGYLMRI